MNKQLRYSLELNKFLKFSIWGFPILSILILIVFLVSTDINNAKILFALPFLGFAFWNWYKYLNRPIKIDVFEDYAILYNVFNKETLLNFNEIISIESNNSKALIIKSKSNKILGVNGFPNFTKFVEDAKRINKEILVKNT